MRNPQMTELNMQIGNAGMVLDWLCGASRLSSSISEMNNFSYANTHYKISGYTLYGSDQAGDTNRKLLIETSKDCIAFLNQRKSAFVYSLSCNNGQIAPVVSVHCNVAENVRRILSRIPDISVTEAGLVDVFPAHCDSSCLLLGWGIPSYEAIDSFLSTNTNLPYSIHIISRPVSESDIAFECTEIERIISGLSRVQHIERYVGQQRIQQSPTLVESALSALHNYLNYCIFGRQHGLWKTHIWVRSLDSESCSLLVADLAARLSGSSDAGEHRVFQRSKGVIPLHRDCLTDSGWLIPRSKGAAAPFHSLLNEVLCDISTDESLAHLCSLPHQSHKGYYVRDAVGGRWQSEPFPPFVRSDIYQAPLINLGYCGGVPYGLNRGSIALNVLVCGKTQSGKSTTMREILYRCKTEKIPFVVLEMVKKEYRRLKAYKGLEDIHVYSFGNDARRISINPLHPEDGTMIQTHIGNIKNAICAMSDMESPLPELIQQCLEEVYLNKGWRLNERANASTRRKYPNMKDLLDSIDLIMERARYGRSHEDIRAALTVRIRKIWSLGLDDANQPFTEKLDSVGQLLNHSSVIELEDLDSESRAFVSGMILARLREYMNSNAYAKLPGMLLVLEEAHEIIPVKEHNTSRSLASASDAFAGLLATSAGLGLSTFVIDQSPSKLNENVIINTGLKLAHCTSYREDIEKLQASMHLTKEQADQLPSLYRGEAIIFDGSYTQPEPYRVNIQMNTEHEPCSSMGCLFCSCSGTPQCQTKRICADHISDASVKLLEQGTLAPAALCDAINYEALRQSKQFDIDEQACIVGRMLTSVSHLSDSRKSGLIFDTLSLILERKKASL